MATPTKIAETSKTGTAELQKRGKSSGVKKEGGDEKEGGDVERKEKKQEGEESSEGTVT